MINLSSFIFTGLDERITTDILRKSQDRTRLVPKQIMVTRGGKTFRQTVWVSPDETSGPYTEKNLGLEEERLPTNMSIRQKTKYLQNIKEEPAITKDLQEIVAAAGSNLEGLDYRLKTPESFMRKVNADVSQKNIDEESALNKTYDAVRYTNISAPKNFTGNYKKIVEAMKSKGYNLFRVKNSWLDSKSSYKGVNAIVTTPTGYKFELQFHTKESYDLKQGLLHKLYEEYRLIETSETRAIEIEKQMRDLSSSLEIPKDVQGIK